MEGMNGSNYLANNYRNNDDSYMHNNICIERQDGYFNANQSSYLNTNFGYPNNTVMIMPNAGQKHTRDYLTNDQEIIQSKYRKADNLVEISPNVITTIPNNNPQRFTAIPGEKPKTLHDWIEHCNDIIKHPRSFEVTKMPPKPIPTVTNLVFQRIPNLAKSFTNVVQLGDNKLDTMYPISKGEVHKISEDKSEVDPHQRLSPLEGGTRSATIVNCPPNNTYGARLLTKMGWRFGEGLGPEKAGIVQAVSFEKKIDRQGIATATEKQLSKAKYPYQGKQTKKVKLKNSDKNPISVLMEHCQKGKLDPPTYTDVEEIGPTNQRQFRVSVTIFNKTYLAEGLYKTKREARAASSSIAAKELNLL